MIGEMEQRLKLCKSVRRSEPENPKDEDKAVQTGDNGVSPIIPLAGLMLAAGAAVVALRKKED